MYPKFSWEVVFSYPWNRKCVNVSNSPLAGSCVGQLLVNHANERQSPSPSLCFYKANLCVWGKKKNQNNSLNYWDNTIKRHQPLPQKSLKQNNKIVSYFSILLEQWPHSGLCFLGADIILGLRAVVSDQLHQLREAPPPSLVVRNAGRAYNGPLGKDSDVQMKL